MLNVLPVAYSAGVLVNVVCGKGRGVRGLVQHCIIQCSQANQCCTWSVKHDPAARLYKVGRWLVGCDDLTGALHVL